MKANNKIEDIVYADLAAHVAAFFDQYPKHGDFTAADGSEIADVLMERFVTIGIRDDVNIRSEFNVVKITSVGPVHSQKLGNIVINWKNIVQEAPTIALTGLGAVGSTYMLIIAAAAVAIQLYSHTKIDLQHTHVEVIKTVALDSSPTPPPTLKIADIIAKCQNSGHSLEAIQQAISQLQDFSIGTVKGENFSLVEKIEISI